MPVQNQQQTVETLIKLKAHYETELEGMRDIYGWISQKFPNVIPDYSCNTDGRVGGTLIEFKRNNSSGLPNVKKQAKRYLCAYNAAALPIPRYSLYIAINSRECTFIDNSNWCTKKKLKTIIKCKWETREDLVKFLNRDEWLPGQINECSIVSYNDLYYSNHLSVRKDDFIKEIGAPEELYIEPYHWNKKGDMERSMLDCLGGKALKKRLGAFFTPDKYVKISTRYVRGAISRVPKGYDYLILDRCAGTGNLQKFLTPEELSHCILSTYVYAEWTTLKGIYEGRVRCIIPHTKDYKDPDGLLSDGDALTEKSNKALTTIIEYETKKAGGKLIVIVLENPPFAEPGAKTNSSLKTSGSFINVEMKKDKNVRGRASTDLANQFIWSMQKYGNERIIFAPIKYWKSQHLLDGKFNEGYICNRKEFHASEAAICLISWTAGKEENNCLSVQSDLGNREIKKIHKNINSLVGDNTKKEKIAEVHLKSGEPHYLNGVLCNEPMNKNACHRILGKDNIFHILPLWVANCYKPKDYTEKGVILKSGDGGTTYQKDKDFSDDCFVWACLTPMNKCISTDQVKNEMCLNQNTEADKLLNINKRNTDLLINLNKILDSIKGTEEYNSEFTYGLYQICRTINIKIEITDRSKDGTPIKISKYPELNALIEEFRGQLNEFYNEHITPKLFKYELLK